MADALNRSRRGDLFGGFAQSSGQTWLMWGGGGGGGRRKRQGGGGQERRGRGLGVHGIVFVKLG